MQPRGLHRSLLITLSLASAACTSSQPPEPYRAASPAIQPVAFWGGEEGAECMARVLSTRTPEAAPRVSVFQNFDVVYARLDFTFRGQRVHLNVVSATKWEANRTSTSTYSPPAQVLERQYLYYFQAGDFSGPKSLAETGAIAAAVIAEWDRSCDAGETHLWGALVP